jgi:hypothetical protein
VIFLARGFWISHLQDTLDGPFPCLGKSDVEGYFEGPYYEWFRFNEVVFSDSCWLKWHRERERECVCVFCGRDLGVVVESFCYFVVVATRIIQSFKVWRMPFPSSLIT